MTKTLIYGIIALIVVIIAAVVAFVLTPPNGSVEEPGRARPGFFDSLFPFNFSAEDEPLFEGDNNENASQTFSKAPTLRQVSQDPVSGGFIFERDGQTFIRFINRGTGHVYETVATSTTVRRVTNTTVPGIQEVLWFDENNFIVRYLSSDDSVETFLARLSPDAEGEQRLNGLFIESYTRAAIDPQKENLLSLITNPKGGSLVLSDPDGGSAREVFTSPITSWVPLQSENSLFVYSSPLSGFEGFLYQIGGGGLIKLVGNIPGLTAKISPNGEYALISSGGTDSMALSLVEIDSNETFASPVSTIAEKCVFISAFDAAAYCGIPNQVPGGAYPNDWLLGRVSFSDALWVIDFRQNAAQLVIDPENDGNQIDIFRPMTNPNETHILFMNKKDLSLWVLQLPF